eukprot:GHRR01015117.1.p1 GENE.GHRR01015117.1~~GHRR01015117.1.p1  ORF type:complete len:235 (+),score=74.77 GHRR01015117.1:484-1188(+)
MQALNVPFSYRCTVPVSERCQPALLRQISCKQPSRHIQTHVSSSAAGLPPNADPTARPVGVPETPAAADSAAATTQPKRNLWQKMKYFFVGDKLDKERLKALGMGAFASYGFISNLNYGTALGISWLAFVKKYGVAPTAEGQWPTFLAFYAGRDTLQRLSGNAALCTGGLWHSCKAPSNSSSHILTHAFHVQQLPGSAACILKRVCATGMLLGQYQQAQPGTGCLQRCWVLLPG